MDVNQKLRVGIVGAGFGGSVLAPAFSANAHCTVTQLASASKEKAERTAKSLIIPKFTDNWLEITESSEIDVVAIATPPSTQARIAASALNAGKSVFCEKPIASNWNEAKGLWELSSQKKIPLVVDFEFPQIPSWKEARSMITSSKLGNIRQVQYDWHTESYVNKPDKAWTACKSWKNNASNGGVLNLFGSHVLYNIEWFLGRISTLKAHIVKPVQGENFAERNVCMTATMESGCPVTISITNDAFCGTGHSITFYGDLGTIRLSNGSADYIKGFELFYAGRELQSLKKLTDSGFSKMDPTNTIDGRILAVKGIVDGLVNWIKTGTESKPDIVDGMRVQQLLDAARLSSSEDKTISTGYELLSAAGVGS